MCSNVHTPQYSFSPWTLPTTLIVPSLRNKAGHLNKDSA